jgi:hypothetical protein
MQYGCMQLLRVTGWVAVIIAAPAVLIIGVAAAHRASASPPRSPRVGGTAPIAASSRGQQVIAAGLARVIEQYFVPQPAP